MYQLFTKLYDSLSAVIRPPEFELIKRAYEAELSHIVQYYQSRVYAVKNQHLLCRLLVTGEVPIQYELERYVEVAYARSPYLAKHFNFTSEIHYGLIQPSVFYGPSNQEIIIYHENYFDASEALKNWKSLQAITVLEHPFSDLSLLLPTGIDHSTDQGLVVIGINIPLLLVQYRGFLLEQYAKTLMPDSEIGLLSVKHFVHMYVLPNMLYSHLELCLLNRTLNLYYGAPMGESLKHHPFIVRDYSHKLDRVLKTVVKRLEHTRMFYFSALKNIPSIEKSDLQEALMMPDLARTRQVWWALLLTRLRTMKFLIYIGGNHGISMNRSMINKLQIDLKRLIDENMLKALLTDDEYFDVMDTITFILMR